MRHTALLVVLLALVTAPTGCREREPANDETPQQEEAPPPDPHAPCKQFLEGTWTRGDFAIRYDPASGAGFVNWRGNRSVVAGAMLECAEATTRLTAKGKLIDIRFVDDDTIEVSSQGYGTASLTRSSPAPASPASPPDRRAH